MKTTKTLFLLGALLALTLNAPGQSSPSALTYNGRLADGGNAVNGWYDFTLNLYTNSASGTPIGNSPQLLTHVGVVNGSFTVTADFGTNLFNGEPRWLEIGVRTNGGNAFATMNPRYAVGTVPVAQYAITTQNMFSQTFPLGIAVYTNAGTFTWTNPGVSSVLVKMWGGGGGGTGFYCTGSGLSGGGGAYCEGVASVTNNFVYFTVGKGGAGNYVGYNGGRACFPTTITSQGGGDSIFINLFAGGGGGTTNSLEANTERYFTTGTGGVGGVATGGSINVSGNGNGGAAGSFYPGLPVSNISMFPGGGSGANGYDGMVIIYY